MCALFLMHWFGSKKLHQESECECSIRSGILKSFVARLRVKMQPKWFVSLKAAQHPVQNETGDLSPAPHLCHSTVTWYKVASCSNHWDLFCHRTEFSHLWLRILSAAECTYVVGKKYFLPSQELLGEATWPVLFRGAE